MNEKMRVVCGWNTAYFSKHRNAFRNVSECGSNRGIVVQISPWRDRSASKALTGVKMCHIFLTQLLK